MADYLPRFFEGYRLDLVLGRTNDSKTYKAASVKTHDYVVLKVIRNEAAQILKTESCKALEGIEGVANVIGQKVVSENKTIITTEYIPGRSIEDIISLECIDTREALKVILDLVTIINKAHKVDVPHGAISPSNVILSNEGNVVLTDFKEQNNQEDIEPKKRKFLDISQIGKLLQEMLGESASSVALKQIIERTDDYSYFDRYSSSGEMLQEVKAVFAASHLEPSVQSNYPDIAEYCHDPLLFKGIMWNRTSERQKTLEAPSECRNIQMFPKVELGLFERIKKMIIGKKCDRPHDSIHDSINHLRISLKQMHYQVVYATSKLFSEHSIADLYSILKEFQAGLNHDQQLKYGQKKLSEIEKYMESIKAFIKNLVANLPMSELPDELVEKFSFKNDIDRLFEERMTRANILAQAKQEKRRLENLVEYQKNMLDRLKKRIMKINVIINSICELIDTEKKLKNLLSMHQVEVSLNDLLKVTFGKGISAQQAYMLIEDLRNNQGVKELPNAFYEEVSKCITIGIYENMRKIAESAYKMSIESTFPLPKNVLVAKQDYTMGI